MLTSLQRLCIIHCVEQLCSGWGKFVYAKLLQSVHIIHRIVACKRTDVSVTTLLLAVSVGFVGEVFCWPFELAHFKQRLISDLPHHNGYPYPIWIVFLNDTLFTKLLLQRAEYGVLVNCSSINCGGWRNGWEWCHLLV